MIEQEIQPALLCIDPSDTRRFWPVVASMIDAGYAAADEYLPANIEADLADGHARLWVVAMGDRIVFAMTTRLIRRRSGLVCQLAAASGYRMDVWKHFHEDFEKYARAEGCSKLVCEGRPGWARALKGYSIVRYVIEKGV